jgi:hypothetical protein
MGRFGNRRRRVVADSRDKGRHQHQRSFHQFGNSHRVGANAADAMIREGQGRVAQEPDRLQERMGNDGFRRLSDLAFLATAGCMETTVIMVTFMIVVMRMCADACRHVGDVAVARTPRSAMT